MVSPFTRVCVSPRLAGRRRQCRSPSQPAVLIQVYRILQNALFCSQTFCWAFLKLCGGGRNSSKATLGSDGGRTDYAMSRNASTSISRFFPIAKRCFKRMYPYGPGSPERLRNLWIGERPIGNKTYSTSTTVSRTKRFTRSFRSSDGSITRATPEGCC